MKRKTYYVKGMHCASCELMIEKRILKEQGVKSADASVGSGSLNIDYEDRYPNVNELNKWFKAEGYIFSDQKIEEKKEPLIYFVEGRGIQINKKILEKKIKTALKIALIFFVLYKIEKSGIAQYVTVSDNSSLPLFFVFGVLAGLSSCAALVGGILLSMSKSFGEKYEYGDKTKTKMVPHLYFHSGRIISYAVFGGILGAIGKTISFENTTVYALITIIVSAVMFIIGLQMAGVKWAEKIQIRMPKFIGRRVAKSANGGTKYMPFAIGAGTIVLPCGFTLIAQGVALTSGSFWKGSMVLLAFVLGTMIPLLFISLLSVKGTKNAKRSRAFSFYVGIILVIFGLYNVNAQFNVLGFPSLSDLGNIKIENSNKTPNTNKSSQTVTIVASGFEYTLTSSNRLKAGAPTKLVVDNQGMRGCGLYLAARGLIKGYVVLKPGENIIDLGTPKAGTYKITCSMGMVSPVTLIFE